MSGKNASERKNTQPTHAPGNRAEHIVQTLESALANGRIEPHYQPQYDYNSGELTGAEVLCRWHDPALGWIPPAEFIPVLEESGQIYALDCYIWEDACRSLRRWLDEKKVAPVPLSVNVSRRDVEQADFVRRLSQLTARYRLPLTLLRLEITETACMEHPERLIRAVKRLQARGFAVEMDDFGSGYSSLSMLKDLPVDTLKMDLHFLADTGMAGRGSRILRAVIGMAHGLNTRVIAEGVETAAQAQAVQDMGCRIMQGYYFGRPMPLCEFEKTLPLAESAARLPN